ncbi:D-alanyl-D-alanine carboxypeptidase family protein [Pontibacillus sp. HMF3514]|uniref:M15 family metallopeptidase n=1 Tax=Pontibacillus sp. HMF3514 TaxID=2692425 RepID=UPI00131F6F63|nr:M15 family metallopeptidase [Pontibacillus sp. HMF3514]QHE51312.1 D-alanyl-D-alanine carboxypeptidase family protein [Pontibacillus sp. HMF3514]
MIRTKMFVLTIGSVLVLAGCGNQSQEELSGNESPEKNSELHQKDQPDEGQFDSEKEEKQDPNQNDQNNGEGTEPEEKKENQKNPSKENDVVPEPTSLQVVVNKQRQLPAGYTPPNLVVPDVPFYFDQFMQKKQMRQEAATALENLFQAASEQGLDLVAASGYRSYARQKSIYQSNVDTYGREEANKFSAQPGHSEHQTGLAMDVTVAELSFKLVQEFGKTPEGDWLAENAYKYGFVIRYPEGKESITGYSYEPWHLRFVGKEDAKEIHEASETLEEFYGHMPGNENPTD